VGESGSGKSTLGRALLRLENSRGEIHFMGHDIQNYGWKEMLPLRRELQIVFQDPFGSMSPRMSVFQVVEEGLLVHGLGVSYRDRRQLVGEALVIAALSFGFAMTAISLMMFWLRNFSYTPFVVYRIALGATLLFITYKIPHFQF